MTAGAAPLIAVCMATYEPRRDRLRRQLDSIREQSWPNWICVISDDCSSDQAFGELLAAVDGDPRFVVSRAARRAGFLRNFERALALAPPAAGLLALADQDDRWDPDKLEALAAELAASPAALLAYSDMRIVDGEGRVLSETFWYLRRNRYDDIASMIVANTVTGAASLIRRELLDLALPFPPAHPDHAVYHDHWLALGALARGGSGGIVYLDRPTYDYSRHVDSVTILAQDRWVAPPRGLTGHLRMHWQRLTRRLRITIQGPGWRSIYIGRYLLILQLATILELRLGERIGARERRALDRMTGAERDPAAALWLLGRSLRPLVGRSETLGRERVLFGGLLWRWLVGRRSARARRRRA